MLVLKRGLYEEVVIVVPPCNYESEIVIRVVRLGNDSCRLGIDADKGVSIDRREVYARRREDFS